jgi:hypothetical protein
MRTLHQKQSFRGIDAIWNQPERTGADEACALVRYARRHCGWGLVGVTTGVTTGSARAIWEKLPEVVTASKRAPAKPMDRLTVMVGLLKSRRTIDQDVALVTPID